LEAFQLSCAALDEGYGIQKLETWESLYFKETVPSKQEHYGSGITHEAEQYELC
jgi:hypothetical protein